MSISFRSLTPLLQVFDMPTSIRFYCDILGFSIVSSSNSGPHFYWAMLKHGETTLMLNTAYEDHERPSIPDSSRVSVHADTALFFDCEDPQRAYDHLQAFQWPAQPPLQTNYGMTQVYTHDPDGYELCFQCPTD